MDEQQKRAVEVSRDSQTLLEGDNLDVWREQVDRARKMSQYSYASFRDALSVYYREMAKAYEKGTQRG